MRFRFFLNALKILFDLSQGGCYSILWLAADLYICQMLNKDGNIISEEVKSRIKKIRLKGLTLSGLQDYFLQIGEPKYRAEQIFNWMYNHLADDFSEMQNLPKNLRYFLSNAGEINTLKLAGSEVSDETGTKKFIFETTEGNIIESVIIPEKKRTTLCISTQVGCPLDCKFCATGLMGYKKNQKIQLEVIISFGYKKASKALISGKG